MWLILILCIIGFILTFVKFTWRCSICNATYEGDLYDLLISKCKHQLK